MYVVGTPQFALYLRRISGAGFAVFGANGEAHAVETPADASVRVNDGAWHYVAGTYDHTTSTLKVYVDGREQASLTAPVGGLLVAPESHMMIGESFTGLIDELRVWSVALKPEPFVPDAGYHWDPSGKYPLTGAEAGLVAYFRFNTAEGGAVPSMGPLALAASAEEGAAPLYVPSAAPVGNAVRLGEDRKAKVTLVTNDGNALLVTKVPERGELYQWDGTPIPYAGALVSDSHGRVWYAPERDFNGEDGMAYVSVRMGTEHDGQVLAQSAETHVALQVAPVNDPPVVTFYTKDPATYAGKPVHIVMKARDVDGTPVLRIINLPARGHLYQADGTRISEVLSAVTDPAGSVMYEPLPNGYGAPYDSFVFAAFDGEAYSVEITVRVTSHADTALALGPGDEVATPALAAAMAEVLADQADDFVGFSLEYWVKLVTDEGLASKPGLGRRRLMQADEGSSYAYADFVTDYTSVPSLHWVVELLVGELSIVPPDLADGQWHHVAFSIDPAVKNVFVDGHLAYSQAVSVGAPNANLLLKVVSVDGNVEATSSSLLEGGLAALLSKVRTGPFLPVQTLYLDELT
eukprot:9480073-Pyramimonas_sp.AAC.1